MTEVNLTGEGEVVSEGRFVLNISKDRMEAVITPAAGDSEQGFAADQLKGEMENQGVVSGILSEPEPRGDGSFVVARGKAPDNGKDAAVKMHVRPVLFRTPKVKGGGEGKVDFRQLHNIVNVDENQLLAEKIPPTDGEPGLDVMGNELPAKPGKDVKLRCGPGACLSEDGSRIISTLDGKCVVADGKPSVFSEHIVNGDVDMSVGNITFGGKELQVMGSVLPGFSLKCRGNITVGKGVHDGVLKAGGILTVRGGVIGQGAELRAKEGINVDFVENGPLLETKGTLEITDFAVQGSFRVGGDLKAVQGKGTIIGGECEVGGSMYVKELGSDAEVSTTVNVGADPELLARKKKLEQDMKIWPERLNETIKNLGALEQIKKKEGLSPDKEEFLKKLTIAMPKLMDQVNHLTETEKELDDKMGELVNECVYVYNTVFPGVMVKIGNAMRVIAQEEHGVVIRYDPATLQIQMRKITPEEKAAIE